MIKLAQRILLSLGALLLLYAATQAQYVDRILRPCGSGATPYVSVVTSVSGDVLIVTCAGKQVLVNGVPIGGGGGTAPGGANLDVQYNNAGAFGGTSGVTFVGTGRFNFAQGTITAQLPFINHTATWNNAGIGFENFISNVTNTASDPNSHLFSWQLNGSAVMDLRRDGLISGVNLTFGRVITLGSSVTGQAGTMFVNTTSSQPEYLIQANSIQAAANRVFGWTQLNDNANFAMDTGVGRNAAGVVEANNGTPGTLAAFRANTMRVTIVTVATLPTCNAGAAGTQSAVSDATAPTYLATIAGGGAVVTPVFCNGTNWVAY